MIKEMIEQIDRVKNWKQFLNENKTEYKEIEFVCHNSDSETSTDKIYKICDQNLHYKP